MEHEQIHPLVEVRSMGGIYVLISQRAPLDPVLGRDAHVEALLAHKGNDVPSVSMARPECIYAHSKQLIPGGELYPRVQVVDLLLRQGNYKTIRCYGDYAGPFVRYVVSVAIIYGVPVINRTTAGSTLDRYLSSWFKLRRCA
jgi:hypothetical protein